MAFGRPLPVIKQGPTAGQTSSLALYCHRSPNRQGMNPVARTEGNCYLNGDMSRLGRDKEWL